MNQGQVFAVMAIICLLDRREYANDGDGRQVFVHGAADNQTAGHRQSTGQKTFQRVGFT